MFSPADRRRENLQHERNSAHIVFDRIWKKAQKPAFVRDIAYKWLAYKLGIPRHKAHFSKLKGSRLREAIQTSRKANAGIVIHWWKMTGRHIQPERNRRGMHVSSISAKVRQVSKVQPVMRVPLIEYTAGPAAAPQGAPDGNHQNTPKSQMKLPL